MSPNPKSVNFLFWRFILRYNKKRKKETKKEIVDQIYMLWETKEHYNAII